MTKLKVWRHGELAFIETKEILKEATLKKTKEFMTGSHGNSHSFTGGKFYEYKKDFIFGYFEAKNTKLYHPEHGEGIGKLKEANLPDGVYEVRKGKEFINQEMKTLKDFKVLDEHIDEKGNPMKILSFTIQNMKTPLKFYNCVCPSSKREYFVGTDKDTCKEAKAACWGFNANEICFINEW